MRVGGGGGVASPAHLHELRDGAAGQRDVANARPDDEPVGLRVRGRVSGGDERRRRAAASGGRGARTTGMTCVTPSPLSMTVPVSDLCVTFLLVQLAASARMACTAMYRPGTLNVSNMISAVYSRFSGVFSGGSVSRK